LTFELSPPILYELGFEAAVEWLGEDILKKHGILFHFKDDGKPKPMGDEARIILFQVVRELLVNVAKHAQARNVRLSIWRDDYIRINLEDDGVGFDVSKIQSYLLNGRFGFFSINERLRHLGGNIEIKAEPNYGTQATIVIPVKGQVKTGE
jgi:signal transduction histidine kinase